METRRSRRALGLAALAAVVLSTPALAQEPETILVEGHVFNTLTQVPILGAKIEVFRSDVPVPEIYPRPPAIAYRTTFSDANGYYSFVLPKYPGATLLYPFQYHLVARCTTDAGLAISNSNVYPEASDEFRRDLYVDVTPRRRTIACTDGALPILGPLPPWRSPLPPLRTR